MHSQFPRLDIHAQKSSNAGIKNLQGGLKEPQSNKMNSRAAVTTSFKVKKDTKS